MLRLLFLMTMVSGCSWLFPGEEPTPTGGGGGTATDAGVATGGGFAAGGAGGAGGGSAHLSISGSGSPGVSRLTAQTSRGPVFVDFDSISVQAQRLVDDPQAGISLSFVASNSVVCSLNILNAELGTTAAPLGRTWTVAGVPVSTTAFTNCLLKSADERVQVQSIQAFTGTLTVSGVLRPGYRPEVGEVDYQVELQGSASAVVGDDTSTWEEMVTAAFQTSGTMVDTDCTLVANGEPCEGRMTGGGSGSTGGGSGAGGSGCNTLQVNRFVSQRLPSHQPPSVIEMNAQPFIANSNDMAQVTLGSVEVDTSTNQPKWFLRLTVPSPASGTVTLIDDQRVPGLELNGGVASFTYAGGFETYWTNKHAGTAMPMGSVTFTSVSSRASGSFSFRAIADGYPTLNSGEVEVSGTFCTP